MSFYIFVLIPKERVVAWCLLYIICLCVAVSFNGVNRYVLVTKDYKSLHNIVQLADIACPWACRK